ncbi:MAG: hypothetical protein VXZ96_00135 [Myxococcota bacterium]|nr:hypothetical protein [Myxococcota bacterium]MEC8378691.1 hypothetical protein [Myxococcota bacterium]
MLLVFLLSCIQDISSPYLGECAVYPKDRYDYGQIGIGDCISGPTELQFMTDEEGAWHLLLTNSNPYLSFDGGSLMSIPYANIDFESGKNIITDLGVSAFPLPSFAGPISLARDNELALVGVRYSNDYRTREASDDVYLFDVQNPSEPQLTPQEKITVEFDPVDIVTDSRTGLSFVANRTSHDISVLDTNGETVSIIQPWPVSALSDASFNTEDRMQHSAELHNLRQLSQEDYLDPTTEVANLTDDIWTLTWIEGTWRVWIPEEGAWQRYDTTGDGNYRPSAFGPVLDVDSRTIETPFYADGVMYYSFEGDLYSAGWDISSQTWNHSLTPIVSVANADCDSPSLAGTETALYLFYGCTNTETGEWSIRRSDIQEGGFVSGQRVVFDKDDAPSLNGLTSPFLTYEPDAEHWRMFFSTYGNTGYLEIQQAVSTDLENWAVLDVEGFGVPNIDVAAPVVSEEADRFRMWYARGDSLVWDIAYAESKDGLNWTDYGTLFELDFAATDAPRVAMQGYPTTAFRLEGEQAGPLSTLIEVGLPYISEQYGWLLTPVVGYWQGSNAFGADSAGGVQIDSVVPDQSLAFGTITDESGVKRIAASAWFEDGSLEGITTVLSPDGSGFDADSVESPVVFENEEGLVMLYAGTRNGRSKIGLATSPNGLQWQRQGVVLNNQNDWESLAVVPSSIENIEGGYRLWYSGNNGSAWKIGSATSTDGQNWTRDSAQPEMMAGKAGDWDDSGVRDPVKDPTSEQPALWYSGFDGQQWQIGYAVYDGEEWIRSSDITDQSRPVIDGQGLFHVSGVRRPVLHQVDEQYRLYYSGEMGSLTRVGAATGVRSDRLRPLLKTPKRSDSLTFETQKGDSTINAIPLDTNTEEVAVTGVGLTALYLDEERGFLFVASKLLPYIIVIDVRDDTDDREDFVDRNYLDIESIIGIPTASGADGYRQLLTLPDSNILYALNDSPEAVWLIDISTLEDNAYPELIQETQSGYLPATSGDEQEQGASSRMFIGPGQMLVHPNEKMMFVSNFNGNSLSVYDLELGPYGTLIAELPHIGENPYAMAFSPDYKHIVVANYTGNVNNDNNLSESTLAILDIDPESPTYLQFLTWIMNR